MIEFDEKADCVGQGRVRVADGSSVRHFGLPVHAIHQLKLLSNRATDFRLVNALQELYVHEKFDDDDERLIRTRVKVSQLLYELGCSVSLKE